jgi:phosphoribosylanthranilate isomerase
MNPPVQIKVCGLTREEDVDLALSLGADYCGFIVYPKSPRGVSLERATELAARVPEGKRVMVDVETSAENLESARAAGFDCFQIHAGLPVDRSTLAAWSKLVGKERLWLAPRVAPEDAFPEATLEFAATILVDTFAKNQVGGTGQVGDWARFAKLQHSYPETHWILAGGLSPENVAAAIASTAATHLDINSGVESAPGIKDPAKLREVFKWLRPS